MLGDKKNRRYDSNLVDKMNRLYEADEQKLKKIRSSHKGVELGKEPIKQDKGDLVKTDIFAFAEQANKIGGVVASMPDLYDAAKSSDKTVVPMLQTNLKEYFLTSTRLYYDIKGPNADIIHYHGIKRVTPNQKTIIVPEYSSASIDEVVKTVEGLKYARTIFNTTDEPEIIKRTLEFLTGKTSDNILLTTLVHEVKQRKQNSPSRGVTIHEEDGKVIISAIDDLKTKGVAIPVMNNRAGK